MNFVIYALPRSQTFWCSQVLTTYNSVCLHEPMSKALIYGAETDINEMIEWMPDENAGYVDFCALGRAPRSFQEVVILRDPRSAYESMRSLGADIQEKKVVEMYEMLVEKSKDPSVLTLQFPVVSKEDVVQLFRHCLGRRPTSSELRKAEAKMYVPKWYAETMLKGGR